MIHHSIRENSISAEFDWLIEHHKSIFLHHRSPSNRIINHMKSIFSFWEAIGLKFLFKNSRLKSMNWQFKALSIENYIKKKYNIIRRISINKLLFLQSIKILLIINTEGIDLILKLCFIEGRIGCFKFEKSA